MSSTLRYVRQLILERDSLKDACDLDRVQPLSEDDGGWCPSRVEGLVSKYSQTDSEAATLYRVALEECAAAGQVALLIVPLIDQAKATHERLAEYLLEVSNGDEPSDREAFEDHCRDVYRLMEHLPLLAAKPLGKPNDDGEIPIEYRIALMPLEAARRMGYVDKYIGEDAARMQIARDIDSGIVKAKKLPAPSRKYWFDVRQDDRLKRD